MFLVYRVLPPSGAPLIPIGFLNSSEIWYFNQGVSVILLSLIVVFMVILPTILLLPNTYSILSEFNIFWEPSNLKTLEVIVFLSSRLQM